MFQEVILIFFCFFAFSESFSSLRRKKLPANARLKPIKIFAPYLSSCSSTAKKSN